jgi:hypothetical protein
MPNIVTKCVAWNEARYDQVLDANLALSLLAEETDELFESTSQTETLDAIGDIVFVAMGVLWKAGANITAIESLLGITPEDTYFDKFSTRPLYLAHVGAIDSILKSAPHVHLAPCIMAINAIYGIVVPRLIASGMIADFYNIVDAICESNNTKVVKGKTDPSVKANIDKGSSFIPPTAALQAILNKYSN